VLTALTTGAELHRALAAPFTDQDLEWKVQTCGKKDGRFWALIVPYLSARAIQQRLDDTVGPGGWRTRYEPILKGQEVDGYLCHLALKIDGEWVEKCDGAELTDIEPIKGGISNAFKRCAVQWGLGRYLYSMPKTWANCHEGGQESAKTKENEWFRWDAPKQQVAPPVKPTQGNGDAPRQQSAPAATTTAPPQKSAAATASPATTSTTGSKPAATEPTAGELRQSHERAMGHQQLLNAGEQQATETKKRANDEYQALKKLHEYLAVGLWKAGKTFQEKADLLARARAAVEKGNEQLGPERFWDIIAEILGDAQWPTAQTHPRSEKGEYLGKGWPTVEVAQRVVDNLVGEKPATSAKEG
jgi:hypothetical protein